ncbi:hypothetical protein ACFL6S_19430 [Candidatus Poribacteria bacterium]
MKIVFPTIILLFFSCIIPVFGINIDGSLTTMAWVRQEPVPRQGEDLYSYLYEYIRVSMADIGDDSLSAYIYARVKKDVANNGKPDWRAFSGYMNWSGPADSSIRIGRQFLPNGLGFWRMDGVRAQFRSFKGVSHSIYAGLSVAPWAIENERDGLVGLEIDLSEIRRLRGGVNLFTNFDSENFERIIIGGHLDSSDYSLFRLRRFIMYSKVNFDALAGELVQGSVTINLNLVEDLGIYTEYFHGKQLFPEESIFSVFAADDRNEGSIGLRYSIAESISLGGRYGRHFSSSLPSNTYEIGLHRSIPYGTSFGVTVLGAEKSDAASRHSGAHFNIGRTITRKFSAMVSAYYNDYRLRESQERDNVYSLQLDLSYRVIDQISAYLRLEDNVDANGDSNFRLLARVRLGFGHGRSTGGAGYGSR